MAKVLAFICAFLLWAVPAAGQAVCGERTEILATLLTKFDEVRNAYGLLPEGVGVVEVFTAQSGKTRTFTILVTYPAGPTCVYFAGTDWRYVSDPGPST